jgi:DNA topoisomerase-1
MSDAIIEITNFTFSPLNNLNQEWITKWEVVKFDWFMRLYVEWTDNENDTDEQNSILPDIKIWEILNWKNIQALQWFSKPPSRYTEASLVKKLEWEWIWRPSTYAPTISTIIERWYIEKFEKKYLKPTEIAFTVTDFLEKYFTKMMEYKFTKNVEEDFDEIAKWNTKYEIMLENFWNNILKKDLENAWENAKKIIEKTWEKCPKCWNDLIYKHSKNWKFIWCLSFPECIYTDMPKEEKNILEELKNKYEWKPCPDWIEWTIVVKTWKYWPFLASSEYPKVKWIWKIRNEKEDILENILKEKWLLIDQESWEELIIKNSRRWLFLAAKNYPKVKIAKNIPKDVYDELNIRLKEKNM